MEVLSITAAATAPPAAAAPVCTIMSECWGIYTGTVWLAIIKRLSLPYILLLLLHLEEDERRKELQYILDPSLLLLRFFFFLAVVQWVVS